MSSRLASALLTAGALGAGAYALLRTDDERKKDLETVDGALGGWVSWAMSAAKEPAAVQMESAPVASAESPATTGQSSSSSSSPAPAPAPAGAASKSAVARRSQPGGSGYPYELTIEPAPAGAGGRWRVQIKCVDHDVAAVKARQEARVEKLMSG
jgi:hypothetical protein